MAKHPIFYVRTKKYRYERRNNFEIFIVFYNNSDSWFNS